MKKQSLFRFLLIACMIALTVAFASCDETGAPTETTAEIIETVETTIEPETTNVLETSDVSETTPAPEATSVPEATVAAHTHSWSSWTTTLKATCASEGKEERTCSCGEKENKSISATGHTEVIDKATPATCTTQGKTEGKHCSVCKVVLVAQETIKATGHTYGEWVVTTPATCTVNGREERVCACGKKETQSINALGHTYGEWTVTKAATCTAKGKQERVCTCGKKETQSINTLGHTYGEWTVTKAATCTVNGKQERVCTCGKKETQTVQKNGHIEGDWIVDKEATCQTEGSQHTVCTVCNKTASTKTIEKLTGEHTYEGGFCSNCGKISPDFSFPSGYITSEPIEIETEYCILKIDENVYLVDGVAEKVDIVCRALEEVTGLKFKNDTYGKDKVIVNVTHGEKPWGSSGEDESPFNAFTVDFTREITIAPRDLFIDSSRSLPHELAHALHFSQTKWRPSKIFIEGFATYVTQLTLQHLAQHHPDIQFSMAPVDYEVQCMVIYTEELYKEEIEYWFEHRFTHMPHYHLDYEYYTIGFRIMWYLHDTYGDFTQWILFREITDPALNYYNEKHAAYSHIDIKNENWFAEIKQIYGTDVLDNFYPWLKTNESLFEFELSTREPFDLTNMKHITLYPDFGYTTYFVETGRISYDNLYINLEEAKKYLTEYKGKSLYYLSFRGTGEGALISYYDKNGNLLYESKKELWFGTEVSYIKLNGSDVIRNLALSGVSDYEENGLGFVIDHPTATQSWTSHYELNYIFDCQDSHLIIPSEVNGLPIKGIKNLYGGTLDQIVEITISEGVEELLYINLSFRYMPNLKTINIPSSLKSIDNWWAGVKTIEIHYASTKSDWDAIEKDSDWDKYLTSYTIHCTDGDITKGG